MSKVAIIKLELDKNPDEKDSELLTIIKDALTGYGLTNVKVSDKIEYKTVIKAKSKKPKRS